MVMCMAIHQNMVSAESSSRRSTTPIRREIHKCAPFRVPDLHRLLRRQPAGREDEPAAESPLLGKIVAQLPASGWHFLPYNS